MVRTLLGIAALFGQSTTPQIQPQWPQIIGLEATRRHSPLLERLIEHSSQPVKVVGQLPGDPSQPESQSVIEQAAAAERDHIRKMFAERDACLAMAKRGNLSVACRRLETDLVETPSDVFSLPLLDLELEARDYKEAFEVASSLVAFSSTGKSWMTEYFCTRASLAAAGLGKVYPGQREFCLSILCRGDSDGGLRAVLPAGEDSQTIACLSSLAIGANFFGTGHNHDAIPYLEAAVSFDPGDPCALYLLARAYANDGYRYSKAVRALQAGMPRSGTGSFHMSMSLDLDLFQKDLARVGDGQPAFPQPKQTQTIDHP